MAETTTTNNNIDATPITSDSTKNSTATATSCGKKQKKEDDPDTIQVSKRRKNCPKALDEIQDFMHSNQSNLSFTFDTKFSECAPPEFTPRFGSFNLLVSTQEKDKCSHQQGTEDEGVGVCGEIEAVNALRAVDKIKEMSEK